jgi:hypothetical protein
MNRKKQNSHRICVGNIPWKRDQLEFIIQKTVLNWARILLLFDEDSVNGGFCRTSLTCSLRGWGCTELEYTHKTCAGETAARERSLKFLPQQSCSHRTARFRSFTQRHNSVNKQAAFVYTPSSRFRDLTCLSFSVLPCL